MDEVPGVTHSAAYMVHSWQIFFIQPSVTTGFHLHLLNMLAYAMVEAHLAVNLGSAHFLRGGLRHLIRLMVFFAVLPFMAGTACELGLRRSFLQKRGPAARPALSRVRSDWPWLEELCCALPSSKLVGVRSVTVSSGQLWHWGCSLSCRSPCHCGSCPRRPRVQITSWWGLELWLFPRAALASGIFPVLVLQTALSLRQFPSRPQSLFCRQGVLGQRLLEGEVARAFAHSRMSISDGVLFRRRRKRGTDSLVGHFMIPSWVSRLPMQRPARDLSPLHSCGQAYELFTAILHRQNHGNFLGPGNVFLPYEDQVSAVLHCSLQVTVLVAAVLIRIDDDLMEQHFVLMPLSRAWGSSLHREWAASCWSWVEMAWAKWLQSTHLLRLKIALLEGGVHHTGDMGGPRFGTSGTLHCGMQWVMCAQES